MKKYPSKLKLLALFALFVMAIGFGASLLLPEPASLPRSAMVRVQQPVVAPAPPPQIGDDEQTVPQATGGISVPVEPEQEPAPGGGGKPKIAIVIDDVGLDIKDSERAIRLPSFITLSFLPYAVRLRDMAGEAREAGHEMLLHMPMEPIGHEDPGPGALLVDLPMRDLQQRFETALASFTGFDGVNNHMGSKFTAYPEGMSMVVDELQQRHLFYLDSRTSAQSIGLKTAVDKGLPAIGRDVFLDDDQSPDMIRQQLQATEHVARRKGYAVAIGHPHAVTLDVLEAWIGEAQRDGFELVPIHDLFKSAQ